MKSLFVICLLLARYGMAVSLIREYIYVSQTMNWTTAQGYCRHHYRDLASITTAEENQRAVKASGQSSIQGWIGLNRKEPYAETWMWSAGEKVNFTNWNSGEPADQNQGESCAAMGPDGWISTACWADCSAICYRRFTLVRQNKTWEEALNYCRSHYSYLAFVDSQTLLDLLKTESEQAQTASVWTGLRFLSGQWFWVERMLPERLASLPSCPARPYHCGAYNFKTSVWENRDCNEELNFLCYY